MTALALVFARRGGSDPCERLPRMVRAMAHRAVDGHDAIVQAPFALAHLHFWTTPEEVGEKQPLRDPAFWSAFAGRIDNRPEIAAALDVPASELASMADGRLFRLAYRRFREGVFERLLGPFAAVVVEPARRRVVCARDPLGDRALFFLLQDGLFAVASEEAALLALPECARDLDEESMARFFAPEEPLPGKTFFKAIADLTPGDVLEVTPDTFRQWQGSRVGPVRRLRYRRDDDYAEHFKELLSRSVAARARSVGTPMVLMSGGLDSTAVAAAAAPLVAARGDRLRSLSYVFDELQSCDERRYILPVVERMGLDASYVAGDGHWPLRDVESWPRNPSTPLEGPYRRLREEVYRVARERGSRVLLTGEFGDELYAGGEYWLADFLREGRWISALRHCVADRWWRRNGSRPRIYALRTSVGRALRVKRGARAASAQRPWLSERSLAMMAGEETAAPHGELRPSQWRMVLHPSAAIGNGTEPFHAARQSVEVRRPYRDRRLIEFVLAIPAHVLYRPGDSKWLVRRAMRGHLPEAVRTRRWPTSVQPLFLRGLCERAGREAERMLFPPQALWRPYVRAEWLRSAFPQRLSGPDGPALLLIWRCLCVELWREQLRPA